MLEFDAASKRFGSLPALDACSFAPPWAAHRLPRTKRGREDHGDADGVRTGRARQWCRALAGRSHRARTAGAVRLHAGGAACIRASFAISSSTSAGSAAGELGGGRTVDTWLDRLGLSGGR